LRRPHISVIRRTYGLVGAFYQVNQSLRWFVDNFAVLAEWRAALFRVVKFREVLSMSENDYERKIRHFNSDISLITRSSKCAASKKAVLNVIELNVQQGGVVSGCFE
jgi:ABC-type uncharacterized transport system fused permease/ATPase subunit